MRGGQIAADHLQFVRALRDVIPRAECKAFAPDGDERYMVDVRYLDEGWTGVVIVVGFARHCYSLVREIDRTVRDAAFERNRRTLEASGGVLEMRGGRR